MALLFRELRRAESSLARKFLYPDFWRMSADAFRLSIIRQVALLSWNPV